MSLLININGYEIDYGKPTDLRLAFNYSIADINKIGDKATQGSNSYNITLPATAGNKQVFGYTEDVNVTNGFDHTKEYDCFVDFDGSRVIEGKARVKQATNKLGTDTYTVTIYGDNATWIPLFRDASLTDLDFSDQTHTYNQSTINNSENLVDSRHYVYPLINYGHFPLQEGSKAVQITDRYPAIRIREMLVRMFSAQGYKLQSDFIDSDFFKRLFLPFSGKAHDEVLSEEFRTSRLFRASYDTSGQNIAIRAGTARVIPFENDSTDGNFDNGSNYNESSYVYEVDTNSSQEFIFNFDYEINVKTTVNKIAIILGIPTTFSSVTKTTDSFDYSYSVVKIQKDIGNGWQNHIVREGVTPSDSISTGFINVKAGDKFRCVIETKLAPPIIMVYSKH